MQQHRLHDVVLYPNGVSYLNFHSFDLFFSTTTTLKIFLWGGGGGSHYTSLTYTKKHLDDLQHGRSCKGNNNGSVPLQRTLLLLQQHHPFRKMHLAFAEL